MTISPPRGLLIAGTVFALLGFIGLAIPVFMTQQTTDVARIGGLRIQATQNTAHVIPPWIAGASLGLGVMLMGFSFYRRS